MASNNVINIVNTLDDLELALLVCLVADQHCIVRGAERQFQQLQNRLKSICAHTFGLTCVALDCSERTTLSDISDAVVLKDSSLAPYGEVQEYAPRPRASSRLSRAPSEDHASKGGKRASNVLDNRKVAHVIVAANLERSCHDVQIQMLELMRSRRMFSRTAVHATPKRFLLVALQSTTAQGTPVYTPFLNDYFFISHTVSPDHFDPSHPPQEAPLSVSSESSAPLMSQEAGTSSLIKPCITEDHLMDLQTLTEEVQLTAEMRRYIHNIVTFLRLHRNVFNGVSSVATRHLNHLSRVLAPLHNMEYVTPSLVGLSVKKVYLHRIEIIKQPAQERSMQWGSDEEAVHDAMLSVTKETILENIVREVECPS